MKYDLSLLDMAGLIQSKSMRICREMDFIECKNVTVHAQLMATDTLVNEGERLNELIRGFAAKLEEGVRAASGQDNESAEKEA